MKKILLSAMLVASALFAQAQVSPNTVDYMVSYDANKAEYTAWVVPSYDTPNAFNADAVEKGITAQFSIKVPKGFEISNLKDAHGEWEKNPLKIGSQEMFVKAGVDQSTEFYIIGKTPVETDLGNFKKGEPIALFSFKANVANSKDVKVLETTDSFVNLAKETFALNVQPSFYSKSGQKPSVNVTPLEQFVKGTTLDDVKNTIANGIDNGNTIKADPNSSNDMSVYPNPIENELNVKFFSLAQDETAQVTVLDANGKTLKSENVTTTSGFNNSKLTLGGLQAGTYYIKTKIGNTETTKKVVK